MTHTFKAGDVVTFFQDTETTKKYGESSRMQDYLEHGTALDVMEVHDDHVLCQYAQNAIYKYDPADLSHVSPLTPLQEQMNAHLAENYNRLRPTLFCSSNPDATPVETNSLNHIEFDDEAMEISFHRGMASTIVWDYHLSFIYGEAKKKLINHFYVAI